MDDAARLDGFIAKYSVEMAALGRDLLARLTLRLPGAQRLVYDNYNALAIGFSANDRVGGVVLSLALFPRWASLFFFRGPSLPDPLRLLRGSGNTVRHVRLPGAGALDDPGIEALIAAALALADPPIDAGGPGRLIIKSVSAKQRPRRP